MKKWSVSRMQTGFKSRPTVFQVRQQSSKGHVTWPGLMRHQCLHHKARWNVYSCVQRRHKHLTRSKKLRPLLQQRCHSSISTPFSIYVLFFCAPLDPFFLSAKSSWWIAPLSVSTGLSTLKIPETELTPLMPCVVLIHRPHSFQPPPPR